MFRKFGTWLFLKHDVKAVQVTLHPVWKIAKVADPYLA